MTWHAERVEGRPVDEAREKLLTQRAKLEQDARDLAAKPIGSKTAAAARFRQEDLLAIAKKIKGIDKKLGRETS